METLVREGHILSWRGAEVRVVGKRAASTLVVAGRKSTAQGKTGRRARRCRVVEEALEGDREEVGPIP
jgi:hypothetical protein